MTSKNRSINGGKLLPAILAAFALAVSGCAPVLNTTVNPGTSTGASGNTSTTTKPTPKTGSQTAAKLTAKSLLAASAKVGASALKVRNLVKAKAPVSNVKVLKTAGKKYRVMHDDDASASAPDTVTADASGDVQLKTADGKTDENVTVASDATQSVDPSNPNSDVKETIAQKVDQDANGADTGNYNVTETKDASGSVKGGEIVFQPDASASSNGEATADIKFDETAGSNGNQASMSITLDDNATDSAGAKDQAQVTEKESDDGTVNVNGTLTLPDGTNATLTVTYNPDGTRTMLLVTTNFTIKVDKLSPDGDGSGKIYDRDPSDPAAVKIGEVTLNAKGDDYMQFTDDNGNLGDKVTFKFPQ